MLVEVENLFSEVSQKAFFNNSLTIQLGAEHHAVVRCAGDAEKAVFSALLEHACTGGNVEPISANTDLLIMLIQLILEQFNYVL